MDEDTLRTFILIVANGSTTSGTGNILSIANRSNSSSSTITHGRLSPSRSRHVSGENDTPSSATFHLAGHAMDDADLIPYFPPLPGPPAGTSSSNTSGSPFAATLTLNASDLDPTSTSANVSVQDVERLLTQLLGSRRKDLPSVAALSVVYCLLFLTGVVGNVSTCAVIARNAYMHTVTNYYLFSLAVSDVLTLIFGLPPELFSIWEAYPWQLGEEFCLFKAFLMETTSYASVLTITGFTVERYLAICHPMRGQRTCGRARAVKCICLVWVVSCACALPYAIHTRLYYFVIDPRDGKPVPDSLLCSIPVKWHERMGYVFQVSTFVFFVLPMVVITVMYVLIGMKLRRKEMTSSSSTIVLHGGLSCHSATTAATRARKAVLRMLVAVVVAFFLCWAPYHAQRLMTLYVPRDRWTQLLLTIQSHLFYVSGVLYFLSSTVNPILYHLLSRKFRQAFRRTLCRCCLGLHSLPPFYKLKAKFVGNGHDGHPRNGGCPHRCAHHHHHHHHQHHHHHHAAGGGGGGHGERGAEGGVGGLAERGGNGSGVGGPGGGGAVGGGAGRVRMKLKMLGHQSTEESYIKMSVLRDPSLSSSPDPPPPACCSGGGGLLLPEGSSAGSHPHSDGRLLAICRHKNCSCRRRTKPSAGRSPFWARGGRRDGPEPGVLPPGERSGCEGRREILSFCQLDWDDSQRVVVSYPDVIPLRYAVKGDLRVQCGGVESRVRGKLWTQGVDDQISVL